MYFPRIGSALASVILAAIPILAVAQSDGHGSHLAKNGLGQAQPPATNLSKDPAWRLYGFQRDGISYFQVNDLAGRVEIIIGNADGVFWTLPAGERPSRVSMPGQRLQLPAGMGQTEVYRGAAFSLMLYGHGADAVWSVEGVSDLSSGAR